MTDYVAQLTREYTTLAIVGSSARGTATQYSDIDLIIVGVEEEHWIHLDHGKYYSVSIVTKNKMEACFQSYDDLSANLIGLQTMDILRDDEGYLNSMKLRAKAYEWREGWTNERTKDFNASLLSWGEEVLKSLNGLMKGHSGTMLAGIFGLTYGLFNMIKLKEGLLLASENDLYETVVEKINHPYFTFLARKAFGIDAHTLEERTKAGLHLMAYMVNQWQPIMNEEVYDWYKKLLKDYEYDVDYTVI